MRDGYGKRSGKKRRREAEGFEDVAMYWARAKRDGKFGLSYLDNQVFSWSVWDIFNRDLLKNKVPIARLPRTFICSVFCLHFYLPRCSSFVHV